MDFPIRRSVRVPLAPLTAAAAAVFVAAGFVLVPADVLETAVTDSGIAALLPAAEPPLGLTARLALAVTLGAGAAAIAWLGALVILGGDGVMTLRPRLRRRPPPFVDAVPVLRRADAHPDAPPRAPLLATRDLGTPFLEIRAAPVPIEADLPRDLDTPLAAFDPAAIPDRPATPVPVVASLAPVVVAPIYAPGERFEAYELRQPTPPSPAQPPIAAPRTDATIHALLDRLERGVARTSDTEPSPREQRLYDTLGDLRRLASR